VSATLNAGVIGLGVGERHISGYEADPRCRVVALCDRNPTKLADVASRHPGRKLTTDADDILNDPSIGIVSIASYDNVHCEQVLTAITNGKHVFVEKPLCLLDKEFGLIVEALRANPSIRLSSNLILRRTPRFVELRRRIQTGVLGTLYYLEGDYDYGRVDKIRTGWRATLPFYSVTHGGGIHLIDLLLWLTGGRIEEVFAYGNRLAAEGTAFRHNDLVVALLRFTDGKTAKISANFPSVVPHYHKLSVYGTAGTFEQAHTGAAYFLSRDPAAASETVSDPYPSAAKGDMLPAFVAHVLDGSEPEVNSSDVLDAMAVSLTIERSLSSGCPEKVRYAADRF
jgi:predicted dehydrogenase